MFSDSVCEKCGQCWGSNGKGPRARPKVPGSVLPGSVLIVRQCATTTTTLSTLPRRYGYHKISGTGTKGAKRCPSAPCTRARGGLQSTSAHTHTLTHTASNDSPERVIPAVPQSTSLLRLDQVDLTDYRLERNGATVPPSRGQSLPTPFFICYVHEGHGPWVK